MLLTDTNDVPEINVPPEPVQYICTLSKRRVIQLTSIFHMHYN